MKNAAATSTTPTANLARFFPRIDEAEAQRKAEAEYAAFIAPIVAAAEKAAEGNNARDIALTAAHAAHSAACAAINPAALEVALARREAGNGDFHSDPVAEAVVALNAADAAFSAASRAAEALNA